MHELVEVEAGRKNNTDKDNSQRRIELLQILAEGCRKYPAYRAKRAATKRCPECVVVWKARCDLNELLYK